MAGLDTSHVINDVNIEQMNGVLNVGTSQSQWQWATNYCIWKPSFSTLLCSITVTKIVLGVLEKNDIPGAFTGLVMGGKDVEHC
jgi:hypothetical protein